MENRNGLVVQAEVTQADGHAERKAALAMLHRHSPGSNRRLTLGADKAYDSEGLLQRRRARAGRGVRRRNVTAVAPRPPADRL